MINFLIFYQSVQRDMKTQGKTKGYDVQQIESSMLQLCVLHLNH